jgi:hypothetical protein
MQIKNEPKTMFDLHTAIIDAGGPEEYLASIDSESGEALCETSHEARLAEHQLQESVP